MMQPDSEEDLSNEVNPEVTEVEDIEALKQALAEEKEKAKGYLSNWQRAEADFINYKRRSEQEKEEISKFSTSMLMLKILPILDDLERAFASSPPRLAKLGWVDGIRLIDRKLRGSLEAQGLSPIQAVGEPFDPHQHEAIRQADGEEGIVLED